MCDGCSIYLHGSERLLSCSQSSGRHIWLFLYPGLDQLPHDSHQRLHVPGAQEAQIDVTGWMQEHAGFINRTTCAQTHTDILYTFPQHTRLLHRFYDTRGDLKICQEFQIYFKLSLSLWDKHTNKHSATHFCPSYTFTLSHTFLLPVLMTVAKKC